MEALECDKEYPKGTVVCPGPDGKLTQCIHDNCPFAVVIAFDPTPGDGTVYNIASSGRVSTRCAQDLLPRTLVVSDGRGGVRSLNPGEPSFVLGFTMNETSVINKSPQVDVFLRSMFVILRGQ